MTRLLFLGLGHLSHGDVSIAADFARQLPAAEFDIGFVSTVDTQRYLGGLGLAATPLAAGSPSRNVASFDTMVADFRPDFLVAADAFTLDYSTGWSGLSMALLRKRYGIPLASFDQYDWTAANYVVDFYADNRTQFPRLLEDCDLLIRNAPLNRPAPSEPGLIVSRMVCAGPPDARPTQPRPEPDLARPTGRGTVFLCNSKWEYLNVVRSPRMQQLITAMPRLIHSHLAGLGRPLLVRHVGPVPWQFPIAEHIEYDYLRSLPPADFHQQVSGADLFVTANAASVTLTQAVLAGVPSLLLQNHETVSLATAPDPAWLATAAPNLTVAHPFRVFPWGWHAFLGPVLRDNPYTDCFLRAGILEPAAVRHALEALLDDGTVRRTLHERQQHLHAQLARLEPAAEAFHQVVTSR